MLTTLENSLSCLKRRMSLDANGFFKDGSPGGTTRYKTRLVAKSYAQREGIDYNEVFYPVMKYSSICILLARVAQYDY